ncbi:cytochrome c biogenesis protein CcsA [Oligoflexus tunisiensis]|uniref:cytochrome c biogenesis protein CcsA n=1 Tax=Oligoflexus tunisiensis TaxID=708132 RepID=UPI00114D37DD|nr:cytochrome c biogenesis protein CcsA [Oligoflexus tunisiensis]
MNFYHLGVISALVAFAGSSGLYLHSFSKSSTQEKIHRAAYGLFMLAAFLMLLNTVNVFLHNVKHLTSSFVLITTTAWLTIFAQVFFNLRIVGSIVAPLSTLIMLIQFFFVAPHGEAAAVESTGLLMSVHILVSVVGEAFAIIAFVIAIFYLIQQQALKKKQLSRLQHTQVSISKLNQALILSIWLGFIFLTCGLIMGAVYSQFYYTGDRMALLGKVLWAFLVWLWYLITLLSRNFFNLSAKRLAWMTILGFVLLAIGLFGINNWSHGFG